MEGATSMHSNPVRPFIDKRNSLASRERFRCPWALATIALLALTIIGCSGGNPTVPSPLDDNPPASRYSGTAGNRILWGMWQFKVDLAGENIEIIPCRNGLAHVNVVTLVEPVPLKYLRLDDSTLEIDMEEGIIDVDVILEHPLPTCPEYTGFDVRGILISHGSWDGLGIDSDLVLPEANETRLLNADGYTRWWNPMEFFGDGILGYSDGLLGIPYNQEGYECTVNGYKYFADGLGPNDDVMQPVVLQGRGRFSASSTNRRHYSIDFGPSQSDFMIFNYAVDASWEHPTNMPPTSLDDFPIDANSLEPFNIDIQEDVNSLYYDPGLEDCPTSGGVLRLRINVATWQGLEGISKVLVGSPDLGIDFFEPNERGGADIYGAHVSTYAADLAPEAFHDYHPQVLVAAYSDLGSYTTGPEGLPIAFRGTNAHPIAVYNMHVPEVGINSPPIVGPVLGPTEVVAGTTYRYEVENYLDCQDSVEDLTFAWEIGDNDPPLYDDGYGNTDGVHPFGNGTIDITFPDEGTYFVDTGVIDTEGKWGYTTQPLEVHAILPPLPEFPPEGVNLVLSLQRSVFFSYEYASNPTDIPAINLEWDGSGVIGEIAEWIVYRDDDPYDGQEMWLEIGTTAPEVMNFSNRLMGEHPYNSGGAYYFMVKARAIKGNPNSESEGSTEWAFIEFENAEIAGAAKDQHPWFMGYGGYESNFYRQWERPGYGGAVSGGCWMMDPDSPYMRRHQWSVIASPELPILADPQLAQTTEEWYIELIFGAQIIPMNECWDNYGRLSVGTVTVTPSTQNHQRKFTDYEEAHPSDYMDGWAYYTKHYWSSVNSRFDESSSSYTDRYGWGKDEYGWPFTWARFRLSDLNPSGTGRLRAAIGFGSGTTSDALARPRADEIAVIIY